MTQPAASPPPVDLQQLVQEADLGGRKPAGVRSSATATTFSMSWAW